MPINCDIKIIQTENVSSEDEDVGGEVEEIVEDDDDIGETIPVVVVEDFTPKSVREITTEEQVENVRFRRSTTDYHLRMQSNRSDEYTKFQSFS